MNKRIKRKRVRQLLLTQLAVRFSSPDDAIAWLESASSDLDGRTPREVIAAGDVERVTLVLDAMNGSAPVA